MSVTSSIVNTERSPTNVQTTYVNSVTTIDIKHCSCADAKATKTASVDQASNEIAEKSRNTSILVVQTAINTEVKQTVTQASTSMEKATSPKA